MVNVGIIGHTGRLGRPLTELLMNHPHAEIVYTESRTEGESGNLLDSELVFLALPQNESEKYLPRLNGKRIIDLSNDHRVNSNWVYGLPEINAEKIRSAKKVSNPGCYATSIILGLAPLKGKINNVYVASASGISGAGLETRQQDNFKVYGEGRLHRHISEIEKELEFEKILFVPQRIDVADKGITSTIFVKAEIKNNLQELYQDFYKSAPFVRLKDEIQTKYVNDTNFCDIKVLDHDGEIVIISALDNTLKGGAGQAIQNFNLMNEFDETLGLER